MRKRIISIAMALVLFISLMSSIGAVPVAAQTAVTTLATGDYYIYSGVGSDKVLDVYGASKTSGSNIIISKFNKSASQVFRVTNMGNGVYTIKNKNSGMMLDVYAASTASGTNVWQYTSNNSNAQKWKLTTSSRSGYYTVQSAISANVLDVYGASNVAGSNVWVYSSNNTAAQQWKFVKAASGSSQPAPVTKKAAFATGYYMIRSKVNSSRYLEVAGDSFANGGNIQLGPSGQQAARIFYLTNLGNGNYTIESALSGKKMEVAGGSTENFTNIQQNTTNSSSAQKWYISTTRSDDFYTISSSINHKKVVDVYGGNTGIGTNIDLYSMNSTDAQYFKFVRVSSPSVTMPEGVFVLRSCLDNKFVVSVPSKSVGNSKHVALYRNSGNNYQKWRITSLGSGNYYITNMGSKQVLHVSGGRKVNGTNVVQYTWFKSKAQVWKITGNRGIFCFRNLASGLTMDVANGTAVNNANIQVYEANGSRAQKFRLENVTYTEAVPRTSEYVVDPATGKTFRVHQEFLTDPVMGEDVTESEFLAAVLYTEAGDQGLSGMMMVGYVIENRLRSGIEAARAGRYVEYPGTLDIMIYHYQQWEVARNGSLTRVLNDIVAGNAGYLTKAKSAASKVLAKQSITLETSATVYTRTGEGVSSIKTLPQGTVMKGSDFFYNSFMTPNAWSRYAATRAKFATYGGGKNTFLYRGHIFFLDEEVW